MNEWWDVSVMKLVNRLNSLHVLKIVNQELLGRSWQNGHADYKDVVIEI